jgi:hypothetical protein
MNDKRSESHHKIVADSLKQIGVKEPDIPDYERLLHEAKARIKNIRDYAILLDEERSKSGKDINRELLAGEVFGKCLDNFHHYSKDELLLFLTRLVSEMILSEVI